MVETDELKTLERDVATLEKRSGIASRRQLDDMEMKRTDLHRRKSEAEAIIAQQEAVSERKGRADRLKVILSERAELLQRIDETIDMLREFVIAEQLSRHGVSELAKGIRRDLRDPLSNDVAVLNAICARLGEFGLAADRRLDKSKPNRRVSTLAGIHENIIAELKRD